MNKIVVFALLLLVVFTIAVAASEDLFEVAEHIAKLSPNCRIRVMEVVSERDFVSDLHKNKLIDQSLFDSHKEEHYKLLEEQCTTDEEKSLARRMYDTASFPFQKFFEYFDNAKVSLKETGNSMFRKLMELPAACRASSFYRLMSQDWIGKFKDKVQNFEDFSKNAANLVENKLLSTCNQAQVGFVDTLRSTADKLKSTSKIINPVKYLFGSFISSLKDIASGVKEQFNEDLGKSEQYIPVHKPNYEQIKATIHPEQADFRDFVHGLKEGAQDKYDKLHHNVDRVVNRVTREVPDKVFNVVHDVRDGLQDKKEEFVDYSKDIESALKRYAEDLKNKIPKPSDAYNKLKDKYEDLKDSAKEGVENLKDRIHADDNSQSDTPSARIESTQPQGVFMGSWLKSLFSRLFPLLVLFLVPGLVYLLASRLIDFTRTAEPIADATTRTTLVTREFSSDVAERIEQRLIHLEQRVEEFGAVLESTQIAEISALSKNLSHLLANMSHVFKESSKDLNTATDVTIVSSTSTKVTSHS